MGDLLAGKVQRSEIDLWRVGRRRNEFAQLQTVFIDPTAIRLLLSQGFLELVIGDEFTRFRVSGEHLTGSKSAFPDDRRIVENHRARFGADVENSILGDLVARWSQPVAIQRSTQFFTICEYKAGRSIPRLGERPVILIERPEIIGNVLIVAVGWRDQHAHRVLR